MQRYRVVYHWISHESFVLNEVFHVYQKMIQRNPKDAAFYIPFFTKRNKDD